MAINEAVNIDIDVNGVNTVKDAANAYEDLGDAVSQTQLEAEKLAQQFGINDKRTQEAIKVAGRYKQEMENLDFAIDAARGGSDQLFRAAQGVTAGFELAAGATAIFGGESEELEKVLLKVQGAMAFSQGLKDLQEFGPAILNIAKATRTWLRSLDLLQKSFLGLGIAAIVGLVYSLRDAFTSVSEETKKAAEEQKEYNDQLRDLQNERIALTQGELKATQARLYQREQELKANDAAIKQTEARIKQDQQVLRLTGDQAIGAEEHRKKLKDLRLENFRLTNEVIKLKKETDNLISTQEKQQNQTEKVTKSIDDGFDKWLANEIRKNEAQKANAKYVEDQRQKQIDDDEEAFQAWLEWEIQKAENAAANAEYITKKKKEESDKQIAMDQAVADAQMQLYLQTQMVTSGLIQLVGEQTKAGKALALAQIAADTAVGYVQGLDIAQKGAKATGPAAPYTFPIFYASQIAAVINAVNQARQVLNGNYSVQTSKITSQQGFGSVSSFNAPAVRLPRTEQFTGQQRIYVTEYDISNTQEKVKVTEDVSIVK